MPRKVSSSKDGSSLEQLGLDSSSIDFLTTPTVDPSDMQQSPDTELSQLCTIMHELSKLPGMEAVRKIVFKLILFGHQSEGKTSLLSALARRPLGGAIVSGIGEGGA